MKRASIVFTLALIAGLWASSEALACGGRRCVNVAPSGSLPCLRCVEDESVSSDCRNDAGSCGCHFVACFASQATSGEETVLATIFSDETQPVACSTLPAEITDSAAE